MDDYLHLTPQGYLKAFEPVHELLCQLLAEGEKENLEDEEDSSSSASAAPTKHEG
jgi:hypothetical protein